MKGRPRNGLFCCVSSTEDIEEDKHLATAKEYLRVRGFSEAEVKAELCYLHGREASLLYRHYPHGLRGKTLRDLKRIVPDFSERLNNLLYPNDFPHHFTHEVLRIILQDKSISIDGLVAFFNLSHYNLEEVELRLQQSRKEGNSYLEAVFAYSAPEVKPPMPN